MRSSALGRMLKYEGDSCRPAKGAGGATGLEIYLISWCVNSPDEHQSDATLGAGGTSARNRPGPSAKGGKAPDPGRERTIATTLAMRPRRYALI